MTTEPIFYNVESWVEENKKFFLPPVCNKMMHNYQLKVFYVGGPNQRKDYHLEEGEELFYMRKGDMCLKILEGGIFKDVKIREGEVFLLPGRIPHSPQRDADTVGLVIERERLRTETDGLRYFVEDGSTSSLFERWFYCDDLGSQLGPVIKEFFASQQHKTGKPIPEDMPEKVPWEPDSQRRVEAPFSLTNWLDNHMEEIRSKGSIRLFDTSYQSDIVVLGKGDHGSKHKSEGNAETLLWVLKGQAKVTLLSNNKEYDLKNDDTLLIPGNAEYSFQTTDSDCAVLSTHMDSANRSRVGF